MFDLNFLSPIDTSGNFWAGVCNATNPQPLKIGSLDSGGYVKFTPKYIILVVEGRGVRIFFGYYLILLGLMQNFRKLGQPLPGEK